MPIRRWVDARIRSGTDGRLHRSSEKRLKRHPLEPVAFLCTLVVAVIHGSIEEIQWQKVV